MLRRLVFLLVGILSLGFINKPLQAQFFCQGKRCDELNNSYGYYFNDFQKKYIPLLTKDIIVAQAMIGVSTPPYVNLEKFTIGLYGTGGYTASSKVTLINENNGSYKEISERGIALSPTYYGGINLGWLFGGWYGTWNDWVNCEDEPCESYYQFPLLSKIDVYVYGSGNFNTKNNLSDDYTDSRRSFNAIGTMLRFHLIEQKQIFGGLVKFSGISIGGGYYSSKQNLNFLFDERLKIDLTPSASYEWYGSNTFQYNTNTKTTFGDLRTGATILNFVTVYGGVGQSLTRGDSELFFHREATIIELNETTIYNITFNGDAKNAVKIPYFLTGINLGFLTIQGTQTIDRNSLTHKHAFAISIGIKFEY